jgi:hypothetical protein
MLLALAIMAACLDNMNATILLIMIHAAFKIKD